MTKNSDIGRAIISDMRISTILLLLFTILLTVVFMQNTGEIKMTVLFADFYLSKLVVFIAIALVGFVIGYRVGKPGKLNRVEDFERHEDTDAPPHGQSLSDEDRDYIS